MQYGTMINRTMQVLSADALQAQHHLQGCATSGLYPHGSLKGSPYSVLCAAALLAAAATALPALLVKLSATVPEPEADQPIIGAVMPKTSLLTMPYAMTRSIAPGTILLIGLRAAKPCVSV